MTRRQHVLLQDPNSNNVIGNVACDCIAKRPLTDLNGFFPMLIGAASSDARRQRVDGSQHRDDEEVLPASDR